MYSKGDVVSNFIIKTNSWDTIEKEQLIYALNKYKTDKGFTKERQVTFVDIGAQIVWFTLSIGILGFRVVAFEPMNDNIYMLRRGLYENPTVDVLFLNKALGRADENCKLILKRKMLAIISSFVIIEILEKISLFLELSK